MSGAVHLSDVGSSGKERFSASSGDESASLLVEAKVGLPMSSADSDSSASAAPRTSLQSDGYPSDFAPPHRAAPAKPARSSSLRKKSRAHRTSAVPRWDIRGHGGRGASLPSWAAVARNVAGRLLRPRVLLLLGLVALVVTSIVAVSVAIHRRRNPRMMPDLYVFDNHPHWSDLKTMMPNKPKFSPYRTDSVSAKQWLEGSIAMASSSSAAPQHPCWVDLHELSRYNLTERFSYARRFVRPVPERSGASLSSAKWRAEPLSSVSSRTLGDVRQPLFPEPQWLRASKKASGLGPDLVHLGRCTEEPLEIEARMTPPPTGGLAPKNLLFGMATTVDRLNDVIPSLATWLGGNEARLVAIVPPDERIGALKRKLVKYGIRASIIDSEDPFLDRYVALIQAFHKLRDEHTKWVGILDDDTTFPSGLPLLMNHLARYDDTKPQYIGSPSEDMFHLVHSGYMAYGGGGVFLSQQLAAELHAVYPKCVSEHREKDGDIRVSRCIYENTQAKLSVDYDMHQTDLIGDASGLLESGDDIVTLHHWKSWYNLNVARMSSAGALCGGACNLQRWRFRPSSWHHSNAVLTHGYSITLYARDVKPDFTRMETTWNMDWPESSFDHSMGPLRPPLREGSDKFSYRLEGLVRSVGEREERLLRQIYIRRARPEEKERGGRDSVIELVWMAPADHSGAANGSSAGVVAQDSALAKEEAAAAAEADAALDAGVALGAKKVVGA